MIGITTLRILCLTVILLNITLTSCAKKNQIYMDKNKKMDFQSEDEKYIISAPLVIKNFVKKNGVTTDKGEVFLQRSVQDYFIKFGRWFIMKKV